MYVNNITAYFTGESGETDCESNLWEPLGDWPQKVIFRNWRNRFGNRCKNRMWWHKPYVRGVDQTHPVCTTRCRRCTVFPRSTLVKHILNSGNNFKPSPYLYLKTSKWMTLKERYFSNEMYEHQEIWLDIKNRKHLSLTTEAIYE